LVRELKQSGLDWMSVAGRARAICAVVIILSATTAIVGSAPPTPAVTPSAASISPQPTSIAPVCPALADPRDIAINATLSGQTISFKFERALDLDREEHATLTAIVYLKNNSNKKIIEYSGKETFLFDDVVRSEGLLSFAIDPGQIVQVNVVYLLGDDNANDAILSTAPLKLIVGCWSSEAIKFSDGSTMSGAKTQ
jgi:hypothetical protein